MICCWSCFDVKTKVFLSVLNRLGFFEGKNTFYNQSQLTSEMGRHYAGQAVKQLYVLVLGLDVLGNPFGLLRRMAEGMEILFYEPYQVLILTHQTVEKNWLGYNCCWACIVIYKSKIQHLLMWEGWKTSHPSVFVSVNIETYINKRTMGLIGHLSNCSMDFAIGALY